MTWVQGCIRIYSQQPLSTLYWLKMQHPLLKTLHHTKTKKSTMKFLVWISLTLFRRQISLKANQSHLSKCLIVLRFTHANWCYSDKTDSISFILRKTEVSPAKKKKQTTAATEKQNKNKTKKNRQTKRNRASYPLPHVPQMTSRSKAYIPCLLVIIIKWHHMITWNKLQHRYGSLRITRKTYDTRT